MIKIICVGKLKEPYLKDAVKLYQKRISKYTKLDIIEVLDSPYENIDKCLKEECYNINKHLNDKDYLILLDIKGKKYDSVALADFIDKTQIFNSNLTFLIGGSYGVSEELKERANCKISFSDLTFPHQLFRVLLLEQLYRAFKINNNESYHK